MSTEKLAITPAVHRQLAVDLFNHTWTLLDKSDRSPAEDETMIHAAHASAYHWLQVGTPLNFERSDWQLSRVYAVLDRPEPALHYAHHCLEICRVESIGDFDLAFAYEALARAYATNQDHDQSQQYLKLAKEAGEQIGEEDDRQYFFAELATVPGGTDQPG
jgi:hypothetical protein